MQTTAIDPTELHKNAFPTLTQAEMDILQPYATCQVFEDGEMVFEAGQADMDLFVVRSGSLEIINPADDNKRIVIHKVGGFSGDIDVLTTRPVVVSGRALGKTHVMRVNNSKLRTILQKEARLSEKLLTAFLQRRELLTEQGKLGLRVLGHRQCSHTTQIREFLYKNFVPFTFSDIQTEDGIKLAEAFGLPGDMPETAQCRTDLPVVECRDGKVLSKPTLREIAEGAGIWRHCPSGDVDLLIVGAGPSGITAAVYAASEGLSTFVVDKLGPGGQAGGSSRIENFMGFPTGLSGAELATRGVLQMLKFGAQLVAPVSVTKIEKSQECRGHDVTLDCGAVIKARSVLIATGVEWRKLAAENADLFEREGVYYACTSVEALLHDKADVAVVGAGNSAGQAAMFLSECCPDRTVHMIVRGTFGPSMSSYLSERIRNCKTITVHEHSEITRVNGDWLVESIDVESKEKGKFNIPAKAVFVFIGSTCSHSWLPADIARDEKGFILTGNDAYNSGKWPLKDRIPCALETSVPGILASGDCRSGGTKRVGFAVGDGSHAISCVHNVLSFNRE